jgi:hypothetical protein
MRNNSTRRSGLRFGLVFPLMLALALASAPHAICRDESPPAESDVKSGVLNSVYEYLSMANRGKPRGFQPLTQEERNHFFCKIPDQSQLGTSGVRHLQVQAGGAQT